jgi:hypothetical protein
MSKNKQNVGLIALVVLVVGTSVQCGKSSFDAQWQSRSGPKIATGAKKASDSVVQGKASGEVLPFNPTRENLRASLSAHPVPEVWLTFTPDKAQSKLPGEDRAAVRVELPPEAKKILSRHWEAAIAYYYNTEIAGVPDAKSFERESLALADSYSNALQELSKLEIDAPDGRRKISLDEAGSLASFLSASASNVIEQVCKVEPGRCHTVKKKPRAEQQQAF